MLETDATCSVTVSLMAESSCNTQPQSLTLPSAFEYYQHVQKSAAYILLFVSISPLPTTALQSRHWIGCLHIRIIFHALPHECYTNYSVVNWLLT